MTENNNNLSMKVKRDAQPLRRKIKTFEFGKHIEIYFGNLEGHGIPSKG